MMLICPNHQSPSIPLCIETDFYLGIEDVVISGDKEEHRRCVVDRAVKRINEPVRIFAGNDREFAAMLHVPADRSVFPLEITWHSLNGRLLRERRAQKCKNQNEGCC